MTKSSTFNGLTIYYPAGLQRPDDQLITRAIKEYYDLEVLQATHVRAIKINYGNSVELKYSFSSGVWSVKAIYFTKKR